MQSDEILLFLALKYNGKWGDELSHIKERKPVDFDFLKGKSELYKDKYISLIDENSYPKQLKDLTEPPLVLFYFGDSNLLKTNYKKMITIIGSRKASDYGLDSVDKIISSLPKDYIIVSGLAKGIDAAAHKSAIKYGLKTIAVLGSGIDVCYPKENQNIYDDIIKNGGLILSEYPNGVQPEKENFPFRNRIVAGLSGTTLVAEAYEKSGTSITVNYALCLGREVCCIPYEINKKSACNMLIKDGATLIENSNDLLNVIKC
ncbi:MAG: DNA-processing protein DprA [Bacilli bacterium]